MPRPDVSPDAALAVDEALQLDRSQIKPMYSELMAIDLPTVIDIAVAQNYEILSARLTVEATRGDLETAIGAAFPAIVPTAVFEGVNGTVRATEGDLVGVGFNTFNPAIAVQWAVNPGRVIYEIIAAKKRLFASEYQEKTVVLETMRVAVVQYYDLVLGQSYVSAAHQGALEAEELLRINRLRTATGSGVPADELRAEARLAERRQDLVTAMAAFYDASLSLALTLRLDASVTMAPAIDELPPTHLVRQDLPIQELLGIAVAYRPDLEQVRVLVEAAQADKGSAWWGAFGPQLQAGYEFGGITGNAKNVRIGNGIPNNLIVNPASPMGVFAPNPLANGFIREGLQRGSRRLQGNDDQTFGLGHQQRVTGSIGWRLSLDAFGRLKTARAVEDQSRIDAQRRLDEVMVEVVAAAQASHAQRQLIALSMQQVASAAEALRLTEANLQAGSMTTLDVLQAQDAATQARLRHAEAVVRYNQSQVNLLAAIGLIDRAALVPEDSPAATATDAAESNDSE